MKTFRRWYYGAAPGEAEEYRDDSVAIIGGANSAGQAALHFAGTAARVTMLIRGESISRGIVPISRRAG